ncbi:TonB-dependent receptor [Gaoshiqia sp. Z1-71]|uniref:TonB-dependent receptor n=1 Tax=Gaoshiqia hydrogeniformans TaxID=3290090 RepID=UPI003BF911BC
MMRLILFLILVSALMTNAKTVSSQSAKLSLTFENANLTEVFEVIEKQLNIGFLVPSNLLTDRRNITLSVKDATVESILQQVLIPNGYEFEFVGKNVVITDRNMVRQVRQQQTISGKVEDVSGFPLPGVTVVVKGTTIGTITDSEGRFSLTNVPADGALVFSFVGMKFQEIQLAGKTVIDVMMEEETIGLDEVVAIGYGVVKKRDVTGAMSSIKSEDFNLGVTAAPEQLIQGKIAGVDIVQSSGRPGATSTVRIRGTSSISAGNDPLYVIDGIPMQFNSANLYVNVSGETGTSPFSSEGSNPLNTLNPADIESIDILKDASATAIYGSRGANGVILITTKSKKELGESISYDTYFGLSSVRKKLDFLSADEYRDYAVTNGYPYPDEGADTDWQDAIFRSALSQNHNLAFGGGSANSNYRASLGYSTQEGIILSSKLEKYTTRLNANHKALDGKLNIAINLTYAKIDNDDVPVSSNVANEGGNILKDALRWAPTLPVYNADGSYYQLGELRVNPVSWKEVTDESHTNNFIGSTSFSYKIIDPLSVSVNLGHTDEAIERFIHIPSTHPVAAAEKGRASISKLKNYSSTMETNLNYAKDFNENTSFSALVGYSFYRYVTENTFTLANQFVSDATAWNLMQSGNILSNTSYKSANRLSSVYGRMNLKLKDRYLFTFTLRNDGSSRFGENYRWGLFPSGAFAWNIADEPFFNKNKITNLKLRLGYGVTGNQEIPNNLYREQLTVSGSSVYVLGGVVIPSVLPSNYANPDLKWEETTQLNLGLDWELFDGRFSGTIDLYKKNTNDLLLEFSTVAPSVVTSQWANVGEVENKGFEFSLNGTLISKNDFQWKASLNFARNLNEVISLSNSQFTRDEINTSPASGLMNHDGSAQIIRPGLPIGTFYGPKFLGLDENGMETYLDVDGVDGADHVVIGNANPDFTFGFSSSVFWKRFDASVSFRGVVGNDIFNNTAAEFSYTKPTPGVNVLKYAVESGVSHEQAAQYSSRWMEDGSYLRLDNLSIGYTFKTKNIAFLSKARVYVTGQNLFVITNYSGFDPEVRTNTNRGGIAPIGIDYLVYPRPQVFMLGANITF